MSRGASPSPGPNHTPWSFPSSASATSLRSNLRINVDSSTSNYRSRSNTAFSPPAHISDHHGHPRSMSQQLTPLETSDARDVALAVRNLRGDLDSPIKSHPLREMVLDEEEGERRPSPDQSGTPPPMDRERGETPLRSGGSGSGGVSTMSRIFKALEKSPDEGDTLDLSRKGIDSIGDAEVEMFRKGVGKDQKGVWRLALSYNSLRDYSFAPSFAHLVRLRYLNLKGNLLTQIPEALLGMDNLEILDLSKNQITSFPAEPGQLSNLKVLSLTHNRIYTLPSYLTTFDNLKVFKVASNPIEWPPKEVLGSLVENDGPSERESGRLRRDEDLRPWIDNMKSWMKQRAAASDQLLERNTTDEDAYLASEEEPMSAVSLDPGQRTPWNLSTPIASAPSSQQTVRRVPRDIDQHSRPSTPSRQSPFLTRLDIQASTSEESLARPASPRYAATRSGSSHARHTSTSSFTPPTSATTVSSSAHSRNPSVNSMQLPAAHPHPANNGGHSRGGSLTASQRYSGQLTAKKSLPDLRQSHAKIISERRGESTPVEQTRQLGLGPAPGSVPDGIRSPPRTAYDGHMMRSATAGPSSPRRMSPRTPSRKASDELMRRLHGDIQDKRKSQEDIIVDESRNSYFRRLSTLPSSSISKSIPPALLRFVDAIRGILFALSQLHTALRQYINFALNERVAGLLNRIMTPAGTYMTNLINALDRFDSMSRRNSVPTQAIHGIISATKESVAVFAKVVSVLRLQSPGLQDSDVRYTRTLLLSIYGSMAEIARSWQTMTPLLQDIRPMLSQDGSGIARSLLGGHKMVPTGSLTGRTPISPIPERGESATPPSVPRGSMSTVTGGSPILEEPEEGVESPPDSLQPTSSSGSVPRARRQGGSFSTHDVEKGMLMGSPGVSKESLPLGYVRHRPSVSAQSGLEQMDESETEEGDVYVSLPPFPIKAISPNGTAATIPLTPPDVAQAQALGLLPPTLPYAQQPNGHKASSSNGSSYAVPTNGSHTGPKRNLSVDVRAPTPSSATLYDDDLLDVLETATEYAFGAWLRLAEDIGASSPSSTGQSHAKSNSQGSLAGVSMLNGHGMSPRTPFDPSMRPYDISAKHHEELVLLLSSAEHLTSALRESLMGVRASPRGQTAGSLPDDAQEFIKVVIKVSGLVKIISQNHPFPPPVRSSISRLTQATRECAILMQVSSLRPTGLTPAPSSANSIHGSSTSAAHRSQYSQSSFGQGGSNDDLLSSRSTSQTSLVGRAPQVKEGLRGLQLPTRQMAINRQRAGPMS